MGEVIGDRNGNFSFSSVVVKMDVDIVKPEHHWDMELFVVVALYAVNRFIENYRVITDRPYIRPVTATQIQQFHLRTLFDDGTYQWAQLGSASGPLHGFGSSIPEDEDLKIREALLRDKNPPTDKVLDVEIQDHLDLDESRLALIESAIMFEAWLSTFLRKKFNGKGLKKNEIDNKFIKGNGYPLSVTQIAKNLVLEATGFDFKKSKEYKDWEIYVRDPRNKLIHGEIFDIDPEMAEAAYDTIKAAIELLKIK